MRVLLILALMSPAAALTGCAAQGEATAAIAGGASPQGSGRAPDEPRRSVTLSPFRLGVAEVTIDEFERFAATAYTDPSLWSPEGWTWAQAHPQGAGAALRAAGRSGEHPVVAVTWYEADAYCRWAGGALPTEAQWERACSGGEGRRYPWGEGEDKDVRWYSEGKFGHIVDVKTSPAAAQDAALAAKEGPLHMAGNVWEWTADWYHRDGTKTGDVTDPSGPPTGTWRVMRGGSYMNLPSYSTCTHREPARPDRVALTVGIRCAFPAR